MCFLITKTLQPSLARESFCLPSVEIMLKQWDSEEVPEKWTNGVIVKLPKKGDLTNCNNFRGVTLLSMTCKVFSQIIKGRGRGREINDYCITRVDSLHIMRSLDQKGRCIGCDQ